MAITSELIGKLGGGAGVEVVPVDVTAVGNSGSEEIFYTVEAAEGETWLVALYGNLQSVSSGSNSSAQLVIGTTELPKRAFNGIIGLAHAGTGTIDVKLNRNTGTGSDSFTGTVYAVKV